MYISNILGAKKRSISVRVKDKVVETGSKKTASLIPEGIVKEIFWEV